MSVEGRKNGRAWKGLGRLNMYLLIRDFGAARHLLGKVGDCGNNIRNYDSLGVEDGTHGP